MEAPEIKGEFLILQNGTRLHLPTLELLTSGQPLNLNLNLSVKGNDNIVNVAGENIINVAGNNNSNIAGENIFNTSK